MTDDELNHAMTAALRNLDPHRFEELAWEADRRLADLQKRLASPAVLLEAALWYANQGLPVFPCQPGGKTPATTHGFKDATTDLEVIRTWWRQTPAANIGLPTGGRYDVLDIDGPPGYRSVAKLADTGRLPEFYAGRVITARGGMHYYLPATGAGNAAGFRPGLDYRGAGGYVIAPPSRAASGRHWRWCNPLAEHGYPMWEADR